MSKQKEFQDEVRATFEKIKSHREPYEIKCAGLQIVVNPNVFSPKYFTDSEYFAEEIPKIIKDSSLLEIGTGTGVVALKSALNGAKVTASDINPNAVKNAQDNFRRHGVKARVLLGDMYEPVKGRKFDFIFWNHPFNRGNNPREELLLRAGFDFNYQGLERYFSGAREHLTGNGNLLLGTGSFADIKDIMKMASRFGFKERLMAKKEFPISPGSRVMNDYRIYGFS